MERLERALWAALLASAGIASAQQDTTSPAKTNSPEDPPASRTAAPRGDAGRSATDTANMFTPKMFDQHDTDHDGNISAAEFDHAQMTNATFAQVDKNRDGKISRDEWTGYRSDRDDMKR